MSRRYNKIRHHDSEDTFKSFSDEYGSSSTDGSTSIRDGYSSNDSSESDGYTFSEDVASSVSTDDGFLPKIMSPKAEASSTPKKSSPARPRSPFSRKTTTPTGGGYDMKRTESAITVHSMLSALDGAVDAVVDVIVPRKEGTKQYTPRRSLSPIRDNKTEFRRNLSFGSKSVGSRSFGSRSFASRSSKKQNTNKSESKGGINSIMSLTTKDTDTVKNTNGSKLKKATTPKKNVQEAPNFFTNLGYSTFEWASPTNEDKKSRPRSRSASPMRSGSKSRGKAEGRNDSPSRNFFWANDERDDTRSASGSKFRKSERRDAEEESVNGDWWDTFMGAFQGLDVAEYDEEPKRRQKYDDDQSTRSRRSFGSRFRRKKSSSVKSSRSTKVKTRTRTWYGRKKNKDMKKEYEGILY